MDRPLTRRRVDHFGAGRDPRRRDPGAAYHDRDNLVRRGAYAAMVVAPCIVHCRNRSDGRTRSSSEEFIPLPGNLDLPALDPGYGTGIANIMRGDRSIARRCAPSSA